MKLPPMNSIKVLAVLFVLLLAGQTVNGQASCEDLIEYVKSESYGSTYYSYNSEAIRQVTFYEVRDDSFNTYYFAIVRFTSSYTDYIYQVGSNTKFNYSTSYLSSAGKAFWKYIQPYSDVLGCAPDF